MTSGLTDPDPITVTTQQGYCTCGPVGVPATLTPLSLCRGCNDASEFCGGFNPKLAQATVMLTVGIRTYPRIGGGLETSKERRLSDLLFGLYAPPTTAQSKRAPSCDATILPGRSSRVAKSEVSEPDVQRTRGTCGLHSTFCI